MSFVCMLPGVNSGGGEDKFVPKTSLIFAFPPPAFPPIPLLTTGTACSVTVFLAFAVK